MEGIRGAVKEVMRRLETKKKTSPTASPQFLLEQALSRKELKHIRLKYFKKGVLSINVDSSSWLYQLNLKKADLLAQLEKKAVDIRDIRFRLGAIK
jgi:predicted nucleic acid-binding Zn ribbon protein